MQRYFVFLMLAGFALPAVVHAGVFSEFPDPHSQRFQLNDQGTVAFVTSVRDQSKESTALFLSLNDGSRIAIVRAEQATPISGFRFAEFRDGFFVLNNRNNVLFSAPLRSETGDFARGVFFYSHDERQIIPVLSPKDLGQFSTGLRLNDLDQAVLNVSVVGQSEKRLLFYDVSTGELTEIAKTGTPAPGGTTFDSFFQMELNNPGTVAFLASFRGWRCKARLLPQTRYSRISPRVILAEDSSVQRFF